MLFVQSAVVKQDKLQTLTRAASATPTNGNTASRRFFFNATNDSSDHSVTSISEETPTESKPEATPVSPHVIVHQGVLSRLTSWGQWKERYFVMDRVGIYWYRTAEAMQLAREQLLGGQGASVFALQQLGLQVAWVLSLRLFRDPRAKNQMSLNSPTKIMKLRAPSVEAMEAWLTAFETLRESLMNELKAAPDVQKEILKEQQANQAQASPPRHARSLSATSHFLGQSTMVVGNTAIVRSRAGTTTSSKHGVKGATFVIGGESDFSEKGDTPQKDNPTNGDTSERAVADYSMKKQSASESMLSKEGLTGQLALLEPRNHSSVSGSGSYLSLDPEASS